MIIIILYMLFCPSSLSFVFISFQLSIAVRNYLGRVGELSALEESIELANKELFGAGQIVARGDA